MCAGYRTLDSLYPSSTSRVAPGLRPGGLPGSSDKLTSIKMGNTMNATLGSQPGERPQDMMCTSARGPRTMSVQEQAGINMTFPGRTEYMQRYAPPAQSPVASDFLINPKPNMGIHGRPLGRGLYQSNFTEYQTRYEWPDGERIVKLPWMRK